MSWLHASTAFVAAFLASLVECVEALTIVLAVGTTRGWRPALLGAAASTIFLIVLIALFGPALGRIPITTLQLVVGVLLLLFGIRWLRKAILRAAGVISMHDEAKIYEKEKALMLESGQPARAKFDTIAFLACFKAVALEGLEVTFTVLAIGAGGSLLVASLGAALAAVLVIGLGFALHRPLSRVPENTLKFTVGIMLTAFGVFWIGEGLRFPWPGEDLALLAMIALLLLFSALAVRIARARTRASVSA
ncbi:MAG: TMEM165/GDT1 family protein [Gemmatimonadaceae bacterium]|nr:TMEM165/GDT1 family protein [Gemmatimonadaceae bacterium]